MILNETYTLSNGVPIPKLGLGTWFIDDGDAAQAVRDAVEIGYRNIDTAQAYGNERGVGEGVRTCGVARDELFVSTKLAAEIKDHDERGRGDRRLAGHPRPRPHRPDADPQPPAVGRLPRRRLRRGQPRGMAGARGRARGGQAARHRRLELPASTTSTTSSPPAPSPRRSTSCSSTSGNTPADLHRPTARTRGARGGLLPHRARRDPEEPRARRDGRALRRDASRSCASATPCSWAPCRCRRRRTPSTCAATPRSTSSSRPWTWRRCGACRRSTTASTARSPSTAAGRCHRDAILSRARRTRCAAAPGQRGGAGPALRAGRVVVVRCQPSVVSRARRSSTSR